jgi:hypothetical protein
MVSYTRSYVDIGDAPFEDMQDIRLAASFFSNGGGAMPMNSNGGQRHEYGRNARGLCDDLP